MGTGLPGISRSTSWLIASVLLGALVCAAPVNADRTIGGTVVTSLDPGEILTAGLNGVTVTVEGTGGNFQTTTATNVVSGLWELVVPDGTYTVTPTMAGYSFQHVPGQTPDGNASWEITVDQAHLAENQSIKFLAEEQIPFDPDLSEVGATTPVPADGTSTSTVTITARNAGDAVVPGIPASSIVVSVDPAGPNVVQPTSATDASGQTTATITSTAVGNFTVNVQIYGEDLSDTAGVEFTALPHLVFTVQPVGPYEAAEAFSVEVTAQDEGGATVGSYSGSVSLALGTNPGGGTLSGGGSVQAVAGVANFANLSIDKAGAGYTLTATGTSVTGGTSDALTITPGDPATLEFTVSPGNGDVDAVLEPNPQVSVYDDQGNLVDDVSIPVGVTLTGGPAQASLSGTTSVNTSGGVATFTDLAVDLQGTYQLLAASTGLPTAQSDQFSTSSEPDLTIAKSDSLDPAEPNDLVVYEIIYGNEGAAPATAVVITETLPAGLAVASVADGGLYSPGEGTITWTIGTLDARTTGQSVSFQATVDPNAVEGRTIWNTNLTIDSAETEVVQAAPESTTIRDIAKPEITLLVPSAGAESTAIDTIVQVQVTDGNEVDFAAMTIYIEDELVYDGANETSGEYGSSLGTCTRTGTATSYRFTFKPSAPYGYEKKVDVEVSAIDKDGNQEDGAYHFWTQVRAFGANARVSSDPASLLQDNPATAATPNGTICVAWEQTTAAGDTNIRVGMLPVDANAFTASVAVADGTNDERHPAVAVDPNSGEIYVVWEAVDPNGYWHVYVSSSDDGTTWTPPALVKAVDPQNPSNQRNPSIGIDGVAPYTIYVAYQDDVADNNDVYVATSTDGTTWTETPITDDLSEQTYPVVGTGGPGNQAYALWQDDRNAAGSGWDLYGAAASDNWTEYLVFGSMTDDHSPATAGMSELVHALWVVDNGFSDILYGNDVNDLPIQGDSITDEPNLAVANPTIALGMARGDQIVFAGWEDSRWAVGGNGDTDILFAEKSSPFGTNILVNDDTGANRQSKPAIGVVGPARNPYLVWVDYRGDNGHIYYAGATAIGEPLCCSMVTDPNDANEVTVQSGTDARLAVTFNTSALPDGIDVDEITVSEVENLPELPVEGGFGLAYNFGPSGTTFDPAAELRIPLPAGAPEYDEYNVYRYDPGDLTSLTFPWTEDGIDNPAERESGPLGDYLVVDVNHFSIFAAAGEDDDDREPWVPFGDGSGGGCALAPWGGTGPVEFILPFAAYVLVLIGIGLVDARRRRADRMGH